MGIFSDFFNYDKEGPGLVEEPPKKGIKKFLFPYLESFWKLTVSGIWCTLFNLPVVTGGLGVSGITNVARNIVQGKHSFGTADFFETVKKNWKQALPIGLINALITVLLCLDVYLCWSFSGDSMMLTAMFVSIVLLIFFIFMEHYIWLMVITFQLDMKTVYLNSLKLTLAGTKRNLLTLLALAPYYLMLVALAFLPMPMLQILLYLILLLILPGYRYYAICYNAFPVIKRYVIDPYYAQHPEADVSLRKALNVMENEPEK